MSEAPSKRCSGCGYELRGLPSTRPCPECGQRRSRPRRARPRRFQDLSETFVRRVRRAAWLLSAAAVLSLCWRLAVLFGGTPSDPIVAGGLGVLVESFWVVGVLVFATPIESPDAVERGLGVRSPLRRAARGLQFGWPVAVALDRIGDFAPGALQITLEWGAYAAWAIGVAGLIALALLLLRWAEWVEDETAESWARGYLWAAAGVPIGLAAVGVCLAVLPPFALVPMLLLAVCGLALLLLLPATILSIGLDLHATVHWQVQRRERDEVLQAEVRSRPRPAPAPPPTRDDAPIPLAEADPRESPSPAE